MKVTVTIEDEIADISGLVGSLADYFSNMKPSPWANVPPHVSTPAKTVDYPPHPQRGED